MNTKFPKSLKSKNKDNDCVSAKVVKDTLGPMVYIVKREITWTTTTS